MADARTVIIARAEFDRELTRREGDVVREAMVRAGHNALIHIDAGKDPLNIEYYGRQGGGDWPLGVPTPASRMERDGEAYIGDGPYGA